MSAKAIQRAVATVADSDGWILQFVLSIKSNQRNSKFRD